MSSKLLAALSVLIILSAMLCMQSQAKALRIVAGPAGAGMVNLPYSVQDNSGNQWMIYQTGWMRQQGNQPLFSQAAMLTVNGNGLGQNNNQARLDPRTGEVIFEGLSAANVQITRRILINRAESYVRYIDIFANPTPQEMSINVQLNTNFNYGVQSSQPVGDPRSKDRPFAWAANLHANRGVVEIFAGKGARNAPQISGQPNNNVCQSSMQLTIPAGKQVALMHIHATSATQESASQFALGLKETQALKDVPIEIRKIIVNVAAMQSIGDREVLRGELFDVLELRGGDQMKGTITETAYKLQTFYGPIELPADRVVGLINVGQFRPRQLLVTVDGEVFGGQLGKETVGMQLSSGQTTQVPLSQILRFGYRKRPGEPEEWTFDRPMIALRSGERMIVAMPAAPIEVMTRYGLLKLKPEAVAAIRLQSEEHGVHEVVLTDGSKFAGLLPAAQFDMQLVGTTTSQNVSFPAATVARLQFSNKTGGGDPSPDDNAPTLELTNQDMLVGTLDGELKLDTMFDTITINAAELRGLVHAIDAGLDVQATLWDQTTLSGQLQSPAVTCQLQSGVSLQIPVALIDRYANPQPRPSETMVERVRGVVAQLSADDWKERELAEAQLLTMGPVVASVLQQMRPSQPPEAQQRIESVLKQLEKMKQAETAPAAAGAPAGVIIDE